MKVHFKRGICGLSGKKDGEVYYYNHALQQTIMRHYTKPDHNPGADWFKNVMANLKLINPSAGYKQNLRDYAILYNQLSANRDKPDANWSNLYMKMLFAMAKANPDIDLTTLSRQQIYDDNLPCITVKAAIEAELLPNVRDSERLTELI